MGRIKEPFDGDNGMLVGGGIRLSPPQSGLIKIGIVLQAYRYSSEGTYPSYAYLYGTTPDGSSADVIINGDTTEKINMTNYSAVLGFGVNSSQYVRPYAGLLFSIINGTESLLQKSILKIVGSRSDGMFSENLHTIIINWRQNAI